MKRFICLLMVLLMVLPLVACAKPEPEIVEVEKVIYVDTSRNINFQKSYDKSREVGVSGLPFSYYFNIPINWKHGGDEITHISAHTKDNPNIKIIKITEYKDFFIINLDVKFPSGNTIVDGNFVVPKTDECIVGDELYFD